MKVLILKKKNFHAGLLFAHITFNWQPSCPEVSQITPSGTLIDRNVSWCRQNRPNLTSELSNCSGCPLIVLLSQVLGESRVRLSQSLSSSDRYCNLIASCCTQSKWSSLLSSLSSPSPSSTARYRNLIADHCTPLCDFCKARKVFAKVWKPPPMCRNCSYRAILSQTSSTSGETMWIHYQQSPPT